MVESDGMLGNVVRAAMTGKIVQVNVTPGQEIQAGEPLLIMESMKMETKILAPKTGKIEEVPFNSVLSLKIARMFSFL